MLRVCSECGVPLTGRPITTKTCTDACRTRRSKRQRRLKAEFAALEENLPGGAHQIAQIVNNQSPDVIRRVMNEELRPVVRDALTEDVLRSVAKMIGLTGRAVDLLAEDLESEDTTIRHRAAALVVKYTVGHPALLAPKDTQQGGQLVVNFNLPRPDTEALEAIDTTPELVRCDSCHEEKPSTEFEAGSERCSSCFEAWKAAVREEFA